MKIELEDLFKRSFVITINKKRYDLFVKIFNKSGFLPIPTKWDGIQLKNSTTQHFLHQIKNSKDILAHASISTSHISIIKLAKYLDWPYVCIFEDDAYPCNNAKNLLEHYLKIIPDDCKCLILGNYMAKNLRYHNDDFFYLTTNDAGLFSGAQSYIIFKSGYDEYLNISANKDFIADHSIVLMDKSFCPYHNLFIQYTTDKSTNGYSNYQLYNKNLNYILTSFPPISTYMNSNSEIPKKLYYGWFGKKPLPNIIKKCIESWKKFIPDFEIIQINEDNYDINKNKYLSTMYKNNKYSFVNDYARHDILYENGGIYIDADEEIFKNINDLIEAGEFLSYTHPRRQIECGAIMCLKKHNHINQLVLEKINNFTSDQIDNLITDRPFFDSEYVTNYFLLNKFNLNDKIQTIFGITIYPTTYFMSSYNLTDQSRGQHLFLSSWKESNIKKFLI